ncbi:helix-turn-helix transcriptional regulator [Bengtsoniella intestinalis]|uniref:helix-turn-helix domain-containing protein n=1 Tax=Bengtsoniella intestinalis TaxID=3073143 RepID=UPI00391F42D9
MDKLTVATGMCLQKHRLEQGLSVEQIGSHIGESATYVEQVERGETAITVALLSKFSTAFNVSITLLFLEIESPEVAEQNYLLRCYKELIKVNAAGQKFLYKWIYKLINSGKEADVEEDPQFDIW